MTNTENATFSLECCNSDFTWQFFFALSVIVVGIYFVAASLFHATFLFSAFLCVLNGLFNEIYDDIILACNNVNALNRLN